MSASETTTILGLKRYAADGTDVYETDDQRSNVNAIEALFASGTVLKHEQGGIEANIAAIADGGMLVGTGTGTMAIRTSILTAGAAGFLKHELGGLEFNASAIADGGMVVGTGTGTMAIRASALTGGASGFVKHELGGLEFDASAIADGGMVVGTGTGTMAIRASALSGGASGFFKHELGGLEFNASAVTTGDVIAGASSGTMAIVAASGASDGDVLTLQADGTVDYETPGGGPSQANQAALEGETNENTYAPPDLLKHTPGFAKFYVKFDAGGTVQGTAYNTTSVADDGTGNWTVTIGTDFSGIDWSCSVTIETTWTRSANIENNGQAAGTLQVRSTDNNGNLSDGGDMHVIGFGDQ